MRRDKTDEYECRLDTGEAKARLPYAEVIERLTRERDEAWAAVTTANFVVAEYQRDLAEAEQRGYLKGLSDAQLAIHHADVLWAHSRAIDALKAKVKDAKAD